MAIYHVMNVIKIFNKLTVLTLTLGILSMSADPREIKVQISDFKNYFVDRQLQMQYF